MSWFNTDGEMSENILYSKFTYTRNISGMGFLHKDPEKINEIIPRAEAILKKNGFHAEELSKRNNRSAMSYLEKQYVDEDFCSFNHNKAIFFNEPCSLSVSFGGTNMINIYAILPGASIKEAHKTSSSAEALLDAEFDFAYNKSIGYLSPIPSMCGSGIRMSCALYLPLLCKSGQLHGISRFLSEYGISLYPLFPQKTEACIYIMTYSPAGSSDTQRCVDTFEKFMLDTVALEKEDCKSLGRDVISNICSDGAEALGGLLYSYSLSEERLIDLTERIRLCLSCGVRDKLWKVVLPSTVNSLLFENLSYTLTESSRTSIASEEELCLYRAAQVKKMVGSLSERSVVNT